jgi:hypothetical protein
LDFHDIDILSKTAAATPKPPVCITCVLSALVPVVAASLFALAAVLTPNENFPHSLYSASVRLAVPAAELCGRPVPAAVCMRSEERNAYRNAVLAGVAAEPEGMASIFQLVKLNIACAMATSFLSRSYTKHADRMGESPGVCTSASPL